MKKLKKFLLIIDRKKWKYWKKLKKIQEEWEDNPIRTIFWNKQGVCLRQEN